MNAEPIFTLHRGSTPLLVSVPHCGVALPDGLQPEMTPRARVLEDTDWHLDRLYAFVVDLGASLLVPRHSRYAIDLNRPGDNMPMYPGANNTELCPTRFFTGEPLYVDGRGPGEAEVDRRRKAYWQPYHDAITHEIDRLRDEHGHAVLFDGHSIKAELPWLFDGRLPDLNLGTADGSSCDPVLRTILANVLEVQATYNHVVDGRFKGGYITRHYGRPIEHVHAVQLEMGWHCYLDDQWLPPTWSDARASNVQEAVLLPLIEAMIAWRPS
jgi:N-formylglutamate deformylase